MYTRREVWSLGSGWHPITHWYAIGVRALMQRPIDENRSWRYLAAMHGFQAALWTRVGYLSPAEPLPAASEQQVYWEQCQHQTWFFLPWHRGYLAAFERMVRAAIVDAGGPADWCLPYWNYFANGALPPCFAAPKLGDGSENPLFIRERYGAQGNGIVVVDPSLLTLDALRQKDFDGPGNGGLTGFGGPVTAFSHYGPRVNNGGLEGQPHNVVHGLIGGSIADPADPRSSLPGLMSTPVTAALDPIFWLHHANIDRLWQVWLDRNGNHHDPDVATWRDGPFDRTFAMPNPDGSASVFYPKEMTDTTSPGLGYVYDDVSDPLNGANRETWRLHNILRLAPDAKAQFTGGPMANAKPELLGAAPAPVPLGAGANNFVHVDLDQAGSKRVLRNFAAAATGALAGEADRVFLNLEGIRGRNDSAVFKVYVHNPQGQGAAALAEHFVGTFSLFGASQAAAPGGQHGGNGISQVFEITELVDTMVLGGAAELPALAVRLEACTPIRPNDDIAIDRVSVYRQGS